MLKLYGALAPMGVMLFAAGCGVSQSRHQEVVNQLVTARKGNETAKEEIQRLEDELEEINKTLKTLEDEKADIAAERDGLAGRVDTLTENLKAARADVAKNEHLASEAQAELKTAQAKIKVFEARTVHVDAMLAQVKAQAQKVQIEVDRLIGRLKGDMASSKRFLDQYNGQSEAAQADEPPPAETPDAP